MSHSYRKPYAPYPYGLSSAKYDKTVANRSVRRAQNSYIRNLRIANVDWDETPIPHRYECAHNDVWGWARDGKQRLIRIDHNDLNPYYCHTKEFEWTEERLMEFHLESLERQVRWIAEIQRK